MLDLMSHFSVLSTTTSFFIFIYIFIFRKQILPGDVLIRVSLHNSHTALRKSKSLSLSLSVVFILSFMLSQTIYSLSLALSLV